MTKVLNNWLKARRPAEMDADFPCTSISLNSNYAAKRHRDGNNAGPSMIAGFGKYTGGELAYWPDDDRTTAVEDLNHKDRKVFNIDKGLVLFDGCRGHEVDDFQGERYSVVWFNCGKYWTMGKDVCDYLKECGFGSRESPDLSDAMKFLPPARGYTGSKSLGAMFGKKETRPEAPRTHWLAEVSSEREDELAEELLSGHAAELEDFVKSKEAFDNAVFAANKAEAALEEQDTKAAMASLFNPSKKEPQVEAIAPASPPPTTRQSAFAEVQSSEKKRPPSKALVDDAPPTKRVCRDGELKATESTLSVAGVQRGDFHSLVEALQAGSMDMLMQYFCTALRGKSPEVLLRAVLELLAPRALLPASVLRLAISQASGRTVSPDEDLTRVALRGRAWGQLTVLKIAEALRAACDALEQAQAKGASREEQDKQAAQHLWSVLSDVQASDAQALLSLLVGQVPLSRTCVLQALGHSFAFLKSGEPRTFKNEEAKHAYMAAMGRVVPRAFGEMGGRCDSLIEALMGDIAPMLLPGNHGPSGGVPVLPMEAMRTSDLDEALCRTAGSELLVERYYAGTRVQIHKLGECIALFTNEQKDLGQSLSKDQLAAIRAAIGPKACIIDAVAVCSKDGESSEVCFHAFDCMWLEGRSLTAQTLQERHQALRRTVLPCDFLQVAPQERFCADVPPTTESMVSLLEEAKAASCPGLVIKSLNSQYEAGRTSAAWMALIA